MGENLDASERSLESALDMLDAVPSGGMPSDELRDIRIKIQMGLNALIQNEKAIWLRTKKGRDILGDFKEASEKLVEAVEQLKGGTSQTSMDGVKAALADVEASAKKLNDETRRRSMVVT